MATNNSVFHGMPRVPLFCIAALLCMALIVVPAAAKTWYVAPSGGDFTDIQSTINAASSGDTIFIRAGTYASDSLDVPAGKDGLTLQGENAGVVTIALSNGDPSQAKLNVESGGVTITDLTFQSCMVYSNSGTGGTVITDNVFRDPPYDEGAIVLVTSNNIVRNNVVSGATGGYSAMAIYQGNNLVENNTVTGGAVAGLSFYGWNSTIMKNTFSNNAYAGIEIYNDGGQIENNRIYLNTINGNGVPITTSGTTTPVNTYWVSPEVVSYTYKGDVYSSNLGNYWDTAYSGTDTDGNGIGDTAYTLPESLGSDTAPLMEPVANYFGGGSTVVAPVAAFNGTPTNGTAPLTVKFTDASTNSPTNWSWDFGDGDSTNATEQNPVHTYSTVGTYNVSLTATNTGGSNSAIQTNYITVSAGSLPDFIITLVNTNSQTTNAGGALFALEPNTVRATVKNNGTATSPAAVLNIVSSDGFTGTGTIPAIAAGSQTLVSITDPTIREQGAVITYTATADPANLVAESYETNNVKASTAKTEVYNGYKGAQYWTGKGNGTTHRTYDLHGGLVYSSGDGKYRSGSFGSGWYTYDTHWTAANLLIPTGATVKEARLYVPYTWDNSNDAPDNVVLAFNGVNMSYEHWEHDQSNFGAYGTYVYGLMTYNVTSDFLPNAENTATFTRPGYMDAISPYGFTLAVVYEDASATRKQIFLNEGFDLLGASTTSYGTTEDEATAYVPFSGMTIDTSNVAAANLITFSPSAYGPEGNLYFNGNTLGTDVWSYDLGANTQVAVDVRDVKSYLKADGNEAAIQSSDTPNACMAAAQEFLVVEYAAGTTGPAAAFSGTPTSGIAPLTVAFTDASTGNVTGWSWEFGDGENSTVQNPSHTYSTNGTYTVSLTVNGAGGSDSVTKAGYIAVGSATPGPAAAFSGTPTSGIAPLTVAFTDASTGNVTGWSWVFGDGETSAVQNPSHTYTSVGTYSVSLTVTEPEGNNTVTKTDYITVGALTAPVAAFSGTPLSGTAPLSVQFTDASTNSPAEWLWDFGDGITSVTQNPQHTFSTAGNYTVSLTATNTAGSNTLTKIGYVTVAETVYAPVADFDANTTSGPAPLAVTFTDTSTNAPTSWSWDFGDGSTSTEQSPVHTYTAAGTYTVKLTVANTAGSNTYIRTSYITATTAVIALPEFTNPPTDLNGDGLYEDLNGNGRADNGDVVVFFKNLDWLNTNEPLAAFDFNDNSRIDNGDVVILFKEL